MARTLSQEARQKALDATLELVADEGISGFTIDGVSKRSGVAKTTLYRHWPSSNELLLAAIDCQIERVPTPDTGALRGDLSEMLTMLATMSADPSKRQMMFELLSAATGDPDLADLHQAMWSERSRPIRTMIERAIERGEIPSIDLELAISLVHGPPLAIMANTHGPLTLDQLDGLVEFIARGLGASQ